MAKSLPQVHVTIGNEGSTGDPWCKLTRERHGVTLHGFHNASTSICHFDGHVKFQGRQAHSAFKYPTGRPVFVR